MNWKQDDDDGDEKEENARWRVLCLNRRLKRDTATIIGKSLQKLLPWTIRP